MQLPLSCSGEYKRLWLETSRFYTIRRGGNAPDYKMWCCHCILFALARCAAAGHFYRTSLSFPRLFWVVVSIACLAATRPEPALGSNLDLTRIQAVVAIRYLQIQGVSHAHLFLYRGDGKLLYQLTRDDSADDCDPVFSADGKEIVFRRHSKSADRFFALRLVDRSVKALPFAPDWYTTALRQRPAAFDYPPLASLPHDAQQQRLADYIKEGDVVYSAPDSSTAIVLKDKPTEADPAQDWYPKEIYLRKENRDILIRTFPFLSLDAASPPAERAMRQKETKVASLRYKSEGEAGEIDGVLVCKGSPFLWLESLHVAFLRQHRGSTDCEGFFALDVDQQRIYEVAPNCGLIVPIPQEPAFLCLCHERYLPLGDHKRSVNCSFLDLWTVGLKRIRFSAPKVARCYGASVFQAEASPAITVISAEKDSD